MYYAWHYLHEITHIDHQFRSVNNDFIYPSNLSEIWKWNSIPYQQSIQMFALIPIAIGLLVFIIAYGVITVCCCYKCGQKQDQSISRRAQSRLLEDNSIHRIDSDERHQRNMSPISHSYSNAQDAPSPEDTSVRAHSVKLTFCASISRYIVSFIAVLLIIGCVFVGYRLDSTIVDVQTNWDDSYQPYDICINYAHSIEHALSSVITQCETIQNTAFPNTDCDPVSGIAQQTETHIQQTLDEMDLYLTDAQVLFWGNSVSLDKYRKYLIYFGLSVLSFIAVIVIALTFCVQSLKTMKRCVCCNSLLSMVLVMGLCIVWVISSVQFALSVNVSDVCNAPENAILQGVNRTNPTQTNKSTFEIVEYYIYCDAQHAYNPLRNHTQNAYDTLLSLNQTIYEIMPFSAVCGISNETEILFDDYNQTLNELRNLLRGLQCDDINGYLDTITTDLCADGINDWFLLYAAQSVVVLLFLIRSCCVCTQPEIDYDVNGNNAHYEKLLNAKDVPRGNVQRREERHSSFVSPPSFQYDKCEAPDPDFNDSDVQKCIKYLLKYLDDVEELEKKAEELQQNGYKKNGIPLHSNLVRKAVAILKNYRLNKDSQFVHPLLKEMV